MLCVFGTVIFIEYFTTPKYIEMVGEKLQVVVAERYDRDPRFWVAYPLLHGPVMLVKGDKLDEGDVVLTRVIDVASDRMVYGMVQR